jgi:hypothetical protein
MIRRFDQPPDERCRLEGAWLLFLYHVHTGTPASHWISSIAKEFAATGAGIIDEDLVSRASKRRNVVPFATGKTVLYVALDAGLSSSKLEIPYCNLQSVPQEVVLPGESDPTVADVLNLSIRQAHRPACSPEEKWTAR